MRYVIALLAGLALGTPVFAQDVIIPEKRVVISHDVDFYGADLTPLFDTTYESCINACLAQNECRAFTFNQKSNACFPKTGIDSTTPFEGARSGEVFYAASQYLNTANTRRQDLSFLSDRQIQAAADLAKDIGRLHGSGPWTVSEMLAALADRRANNNFESAVRWAGGAVAKADTADLWLEYSRLNLQIKENGRTPSKNRNRAMNAAINAFLRGDNKPIQASALSQLAYALQLNGGGRQSIDALRLANDLHPRIEFAEALEDAIGKYGFRVTESVVESDLADPRICAQFNEPLRKTGVDFDPFVARANHRLAVTAEGTRLCVSGLEHGQRYQLTFREGLPAESGETLHKDVQVNLYVRDREPSLRFPGRAYVLPKSADAGLPIETVNLDSVELKLHRVSDRNLLRAIQDSYFGKPLSYWQEQIFDSEIAETVWSGSGDVNNDLNIDMTTRLPIGDVVADLEPGAYALTASIRGADPYDETDATQWFILSDIGVTTLSGVDGLHVFTRSLSDASVLTGTKATLLSRANRVLDTISVDDQGYAKFDAGLSRGTGGAAPALLVLENDDDFAFLSLTDPAFDLSDRGVEGRPPAPPIDLFVATDRGAYRAGETIYATALMRNEKVAALSGLPLTAILKRPDNVEYSRHLSTNDSAGGHVFEMPVATTVPRGAWTLAFYSDVNAAPINTQTILIEDFTPERIDFDLTLPERPLRPGQYADLTVKARYLFGAPGADLPVAGEVTLRRIPELPGFPGYAFGRHDSWFNPATDYFGTERTAADGTLNIGVSVPDTQNADLPLQAEITARIIQGSGRPVERRITHPVAPSKPMIGIKPMFDGVVPEGSEATFEVIGLNTDLERTDMQVNWSLNRVTRRYQWYQLYGEWAWEPITTRKRITGGTSTLGQDGLRLSEPVDWGNYELVIERTDGDYVASSFDFYAGWYAPADTGATPDTLELSLDKENYLPGETAQVRIVPRYAGKALVSVMSNRLIAMKAVDVSEGENLIDLPVTDEWGAGAYVTASVIRPMDETAGQNPARSLGLSYAKIDPGAKELIVALDAADKIAPNGTLDVRLNVDGLSEGQTAFATLAAVDVGILNLTGFDSPDPSDHYFGQRRLGMDIRDIYGRLIDGQNGAMGALRSGGDATNRAQLQSPPPTEDLVAYFEGPITIGPDGVADVQFDIPEFNGTVRLMAVVWSDTAVGQADKDVIVRNPVVVTASVPRFLAPGDQSRLLLEIVHAEGPTGTMPLSVSTNGLLLDTASTPAAITLGEQETARITIPVTAADVGDHDLSVMLTTPDGKALIKKLRLGVRANDPEVSTTERFLLSAGESFDLNGELFGGLRDGTGSAIVASGPLAKFDAPALLHSLDRYPYGCTEQITSRVMPLLYFDEVAAALGLGEQERIKERVDQAIAQILTRQATNGAFGLWRVGSGDFWLDAYVSDFLSQAKAAGYDVPDLAFRQALDNLRNRINYAPDFDSGGEDIAYALMVLAREGAAAMGDLRYYADVKAEAFDTPLAAAQLATALAYYGDQTRSDFMFAQSARQFLGASDDTTPVWRADYGSQLRDTAGLLSLAVQSGSDVINASALVDRIASAGRPMSTQESSWALRAAHALVTDPETPTIAVDGVASDGPFVHQFVDYGSSSLITNISNTTQEITITKVGVPLEPLPKDGYGYAIERSYFTMQGDPMDPEAVQVGDRFVAVLKVTPFERIGARLMVNDPLPAGFEIDNPNLLRSGDVRELDWLNLNEARHSEFRSDRFLSAVDWRSDASFQLGYIVRAVSPGVFHHPAASVEDMYRPQYRARTDAGRIVIGQ